MSQLRILFNGNVTDNIEWRRRGAREPPDGGMNLENGVLVKKKFREWRTKTFVDHLRAHELNYSF